MCSPDNKSRGTSTVASRVMNCQLSVALAEAGTAELGIRAVGYAILNAIDSIADRCLPGVY